MLILVLPQITPMPLLRSAEPFDHPDCLYEIKHDGFRGLAYINGHHCQLISRRRHVYKSWPYLRDQFAHTMRCDQAVLYGEIVCLGPDGRSRFNDLLFRAEAPLEGDYAEGAVARPLR
jgi:bifunctional non-homologous end joining protein LigD